MWLFRYICKWVESQFEWKIINASVFGYAKMEKVNHESERELVLVCVCVCVWESGCVCVCVFMWWWWVWKKCCTQFLVCMLGGAVTECSSCSSGRQNISRASNNDNCMRGRRGRMISLPLSLSSSLPLSLLPPPVQVGANHAVSVMSCWCCSVWSLPPSILCSTCCLCFGWEKKTRIIVSLKKIFDFLFQTTNTWYVIAYS